MNKVVTRIYPESVIKKYQSKINTLGSSTIIDVYTFLLSRLLLEIILFILLVWSNYINYYSYIYSLLI